MINIDIPSLNQTGIHVLVFKTNIRTENDKQRVKPLLDGLPPVKEWHVDMEDVDCVLRVVSSAPETAEIIRHLRANGYQCEELA